jgi:hypothetical protein
MMVFFYTLKENTSCACLIKGATWEVNVQVEMRGIFVSLA